MFSSKMVNEFIYFYHAALRHGTPSYNNMGKADFLYFEVEAPEDQLDIFCKNQKKIKVRF